eukprot:350131-Chlamydomonas_euryale.AAC.7
MAGGDPPARREVLREGWVFKATADQGVVVRRYARVYRHGAFVMQHHDAADDAARRKTWHLDLRCELSPDEDSSIQTPVVRQVRPRGTWGITACICSKRRGEAVTLSMYARVCTPRTRLAPLPGLGSKLLERRGVTGVWRNWVAKLAKPRRDLAQPGATSPVPPKRLGKKTRRVVLVVGFLKSLAALGGPISAAAFAKAVANAT